MLLDALFTVLFAIINIMMIPLLPLFSWVPKASDVIPNTVPALVDDFFGVAQPIFYYLNLGPFITFLMLFIGGIMGVRVLLMMLDMILPPIPVVGKIYERIASFIRGI